MTTFRPATQRTVFAVITASAVGSGCYAWMARGSAARSPSAAVWRSSMPTTEVAPPGTGFFGAFRSRTVACAGAVQPAVTSTSKGSSVDDDRKSLRPLVVCGPSGVGKGTLINMLLEDFPGRFGFSVSHTTRNPRPGEMDGTHYHFVTDKDHIHKMIDDGKFIEHANVHGNVYGTSIAAVQDVTARDKICVLDIDVQGVESVKGTDRSVLDPHYLFIAAPSMDVLEARLRGRGTETEEALQRRLRNSRGEMEYGTKPGTFEKVLVNDGLQEAYAELKETAKAWYPQLAQDVEERLAQEVDKRTETPNQT